MTTRICTAERCSSTLQPRQTGTVGGAALLLGWFRSSVGTAFMGVRTILISATRPVPVAMLFTGASLFGGRLRSVVLAFGLRCSVVLISVRVMMLEATQFGTRGFE